MRIQYMSDLHMELADNSRYLKNVEFPVTADSRIDVWIYGHSHTNIDTVIGNTKIISNQMGYIFENEHLLHGFDASKYIGL